MKEVKERGRCDSCLYKKALSAYGRIQCNHPVVSRILNELSERQPGFSLASALNKIGKELNLEFKEKSYENPWFNFPFCFNPHGVETCSGFEKKKPMLPRHYSALKKIEGPR